MAAAGDGGSDTLTLTVYDNCSTINTVCPDHASALTSVQVGRPAG